MNNTIKPDYSKLASYFILDDAGNVVELKDTEEDIKKYCSFRAEINKRVVLRSVLTDPHNAEYSVTTVFTGMNTNYNKDGFPLLWSTGVFQNQKLIDEIETDTKEKSISNHNEICKKIQEGRYYPGTLTGNDIDTTNTFFDDAKALTDSEKQAFLDNIERTCKRTVKMIEIGKSIYNKDELTKK